MIGHLRCASLAYNLCLCGIFYHYSFPDNGTFAWAMMTAIAALATGLLAPVLGHLADKKGLVKKGAYPQ